MRKGKITKDTALSPQHLDKLIEEATVAHLHRPKRASTRYCTTLLPISAQAPHQAAESRTSKQSIRLGAARQASTM
ncbi:MAG: hypothetical protein WAL02_12180 [Rhodoplanes sp.]